MSTALVRIGAIPAMGLCSICPEPGHCCKRFTLSWLPFGLANWKAEASQRLREWGLPFIPVEIREVSGLGADEKADLYYGCPKLTPEGRCGIYEFRPEPCR